MPEGNFKKFHPQDKFPSGEFFLSFKGSRQYERFVEDNDCGDQ